MFDKIFNKAVLPAAPMFQDLHSCQQVYCYIIEENLKVVLARHGRRKNYPWIDTKFNIDSGCDFPENDPIRGSTAVYGWIQGRALESLAGHIKWLYNRPSSDVNKELINKGKTVLQLMARQLETVRNCNNGHLYFLMTPEGQPFTVESTGGRNCITLTSDSPYNYSDLFAAKGLYAAGICLEDDDMCCRARQYCLDVSVAICEGTFVSDQQQLDGRNPSQYQVGRYSFGPYMIAIGMMALLAAHEPQQKWLTLGLDLVDRILTRHVNLEGKWPFLRQWDVSEFVDDNANPYNSNGMILSDPGHALEFVGLTLKFLDVTRPNCLQQQIFRIDKIASLMQPILQHSFINGYQPEVGGICKLYDLIGHKSINSDMPWWSLPETLRAAIYCWQSAKSDADRADCLGIVSKCHNSFILRYLRPQSGYMAVQSLAIDGSVSSAIPAVPDADPLYHTGLSLIDVVTILERT